MNRCQGPCLEHCSKINVSYIILFFIIGCLLTYFVFVRKIQNPFKPRFNANNLYKTISNVK